ncbi:MAG: hypothetical protein EKK53_04450 [Burkholderiales bacterium]|jgi:site-specific recombinase XerD|nr:hypothetical protein [Burkholderiaceae bacterium]RTL46283.1 MAG: hypothetical protein EKK53_04450 [Burkholderiales bacterium]
MSEERTSILYAANRWLDAGAHLSAAARTAYGGEAKRFIEHLDAAGIRDVQSITEPHWLGYLADLPRCRPITGTRRKEALKPSSALQAARLTRAFLRFCWTQGWLRWVPSIGSQRCDGFDQSEAFRMPPGLVEFLLDPGDGDGEDESRSRCVVGLAFWGGFRPKEIAQLKGRDLVLAADGSGVLRTEWRAEEVVMPAVAVKHLTHYAGLRVARAGRLAREAALIVRLGSETPLSAGAAWRLLREWTDAQTEHAEGYRLSTRAIRETHAQLAGVDAGDYLGAIERQTATRQRTTRLTLPRQVGGQRVTADLLSKMAASIGAS